jgi:hypothetical protein
MTRLQPGLDLRGVASVHAAPRPCGASESVADLVRPVQRDLTPGLLSARRSAETLAVASALPFGLTSLVVFEFNLLDPEAPGGFCVHVGRAGSGVLSEIAHAEGAQGAAPFGPLRSAPWHGARRLARAWGAPGSALGRLLHSITLEFDLPQMTSTPLTPFVFLSASRIGVLTSARSGGADWIAEQALPALLGRPVHRALAAQLSKCARELPPGSAITDVGIAFGRTPASVRVNVADLPRRCALRYARRVGWPGSNSAARLVERVLGDLEGRADQIKLCLDVRRGVAAGLGLEVGLGASKAMRADSWRQIAELMHRRGLCRDAAVDRLAALPAVLPHAPASEWPPALQAASDLMGGRYRSFIVRGISHVKWSLQADCGEQAKAYAFAGYGWRRSPARKLATALGEV